MGRMGTDDVAGRGGRLGGNGPGERLVWMRMANNRGPPGQALAGPYDAG